MNIGSLLTRHARYRPDHLAVIFEQRRLSFRDFNQRVNRLANALLTLGVSKGDKIGAILPNCLELLEIYWAVAKIGAVIVPLSPLLRSKALATLLNDSDATTVITDPDFVEALDAIKPYLPAVGVDRYIVTGEAGATGYQKYCALTTDASDKNPPEFGITDDDPYNIIYSSGTTGAPRGSFTLTTFGGCTVRYSPRPSACSRRAGSCTRAHSSSTAPLSR